MTITERLIRVAAAAALVVGVGAWATSASAATPDTAGSGEISHANATESGLVTGEETLLDSSAPVADEHATEAESAGGAERVVLPEPDELIFGTIAFLIFFAFVSRLVFPQLRKAQEARTNAVKEQLEAAEAAKAAAEAERADLKAQLADARSRAEEIIRTETAAAQQRASEIIARADAEAAEIVNKARTDAEAEKGRVMADLQSEVADLTLHAARQVLDRELSDPAAQKALVEQFITSSRS